MKIERERGISVVTSVMTFEFEGLGVQPADTPGHEDFSENLPHADRGRFGRVVSTPPRASRRGPQAVRGLPAARLSDITFINKMDPRKPRLLRSPGRDRKTLASTPTPMTGRSAAAAISLALNDVADGASGCSKGGGPKRERRQQIDLADLAGFNAISDPARSRKNRAGAEACKPFELAGASARAI